VTEEDVNKYSRPYGNCKNREGGIVVTILDGKVDLAEFFSNLPQEDVLKLEKAVKDALSDLKTQWCNKPLVVVLPVMDDNLNEMQEVSEDNQELIARLYTKLDEAEQAIKRKSELVDKLIDSLGALSRE
jgi:hypothetical protein